LDLVVNIHMKTDTKTHGNAKENCEKPRRNVSIIIVTNLLSKFY